MFTTQQPVEQCKTQNIPCMHHAYEYCQLPHHPPHDSSFSLKLFVMMHIEKGDFAYDGNFDFNIYSVREFFKLQNDTLYIEFDQCNQTF